MKVTISGQNVYDFEVSIPASKSLSHRALIAAALSDGSCLVRHPVFNKDTEATLSAMAKRGASFKRIGEDILVHGTAVSQYDHSVIDCLESGSTLRFLIPVFAVSETESIFTGHGRLMERPQTVYEELFSSQGLQFAKADANLYVGGPLGSGRFAVRGDISSQFISGLLFALPLAPGDSVIEVIPPFESKSYVGLTLEFLQKAGIVIDTAGNTYQIPGFQRYHLSSVSIAGDDSQSAFFAALSLLCNVTVTMHNLDHQSKQGDHVILQHMEQFGAHVDECDDGYVIQPGTKCGAHIDLADCPDLGPMEFALAAAIPAETVFTHCARLRMKESDRIACMQEELAKLGIHVIAQEDMVVIHGSEKITGGVTLNGHNDHRIVMALSILACMAENPVSIEDAQAVTKSYPDFFVDLRRSGAMIQED